MQSILNFFVNEIFTVEGALWALVFFVGWLLWTLYRGFKTGNFFDEFSNFLTKILAEDSPIENLLEQHIVNWSEADKQIILTIADVLDPLTKTTVTDVDDKHLERIRQLVELPSSPASDTSAPLG